MAILTVLRHKFYNNDGTVAAFGKVYTFEAGTTTPTATFTDSSGTVENANPTILNAKGEFPDGTDMWVIGQIKVNLLQSDDTQVTGWPVDNIGSGVTDNDATARWAGIAGGTANALTITPNPAISAYVIGQSFIFKSGAAENTAATTIAVSGLVGIAIQVNGSACVGGEILANSYYHIVLNSLTTAQIGKLGEELLSELKRYTTTATAAGTTTLTAASTHYQYFTGTTTQTVVLPVVSTLRLSHSYVIHNDSTGIVTINSSGGNLVLSLPAGAFAEIICILITGVTEASWSVQIAAEINGDVTQAFTASNYTTAQGIKFPAVQNPSADANTLDDYEEGTFTPVLTFVTPGDLVVAYTAQIGRYTKSGNQVTIQVDIRTSTFTHTTASSNLKITGIPYTPRATGAKWPGALIFQGITKANYTNFACIAAASDPAFYIEASGSGVLRMIVVATDVPTGGDIIIQSQLTYEV